MQSPNSAGGGGNLAGGGGRQGGGYPAGQGGGAKSIYTIYNTHFNSTAWVIIPNCFLIVYTVEHFTFPHREIFNNRKQ